MRKTMKTITTLNLALCACATPYQPAGRGLLGYKDAHIRDNIYYVQFRGNEALDTVLAAQYFHRRAKEVCAENHYHDYRLSQERDTTNYSGGVYGTVASMSGLPGFAGYVECLQ